MKFWDESVKARALQVLGVTNCSESNLKRCFKALIAKYHPDSGTSQHEDQAKVLIEAYQVLRGKIKPSECQFLDNDKLLYPLLPDGVNLIKLGIKYEDWVRNTFFGFVQPRKETNQTNNRKRTIQRGF